MPTFHLKSSRVQPIPGIRPVHIAVINSPPGIASLSILEIQDLTTFHQLLHLSQLTSRVTAVGHQPTPFLTCFSTNVAEHCPVLVLAVHLPITQSTHYFYSGWCWIENAHPTRVLIQCSELWVVSPTSVNILGQRGRLWKCIVYFVSGLASVAIEHFKNVFWMLPGNTTMFLTFYIVPEVIRWLVIHIHPYAFIFSLLPFCCGFIVTLLLPPTPSEFPLVVFPHSSPRGRERHSGLFRIFIPFFLLGGL